MWQTEFGSDCSFIVSESSTTAASTFLLRFLRMNTTRASLERDSLSASRRYVISSGPVNLHYSHAMCLPTFYATRWQHRIRIKHDAKCKRRRIFVYCLVATQEGEGGGGEEEEEEGRKEEEELI